MQPAELALAQQLIEQQLSERPATPRPIPTRRSSASSNRSTRRSPARRSPWQSRAPASSGGEVIDLMEALRKSIGANKRQPAAAKSAGKAAALVADTAPRKTARRAAAPATTAAEPSEPASDG